LRDAWTGFHERKGEKMPLFRKKPVVVEAVQLRWDTWSEMCAFWWRNWWMENQKATQENTGGSDYSFPPWEEVTYAKNKN
jgi:hypothetical protein